MRPKHPNRDLEALLSRMEDKGWTISKRPRGYYKAKCPCDDKHMKTVHVTPSNPNYQKNLEAQLRRSTCWI